ncbi:hypothetical protein [Flavobacterium granuli]|uniref:Uncharacterized protein n=1 Tax=Flavobacterium granuli TaxID=280093 RepID=A0ABU1S6A7_9FLAO|nr:hypothetical protein [Flavobacterium granuli]MDR6845674.1 hypothetical protein [Flavobacterium granuli]
MKKIFLLFALIFAFQFCYSQENEINKDTISLKEVLIKKGSNRKEMKAIIKKIKYNLRENYNLGSINYLMNHFSIKDDSDTLVNSKTIKKLEIKVLSQFNIHSMLIDDPKKSFDIDTSPYARFEPNISNNDHLLSLSIFYNSLHVNDFDFFDMSRDYKYKISKEGDVTTVTFIATRFYSGYFSFNNINYNLIRIAFKNTKPYDYYSWGYQGISSESGFEFESQWKYNKVTVLLDFIETDKGRLLLKKMDAMEELTQFEFKRHLSNSKRVIDQDRNIKFYTTLSMRILD